jgi:hypothetical protein
MTATVNQLSADMYTVTFKGFVSLDHAQAFAAWYDGQGEQDSDDWLTESGVPTAYVTGRHVVEGDNVILDIKPKEDF